MFLYSHWLSLSLPRRIEIAGIFGIEKKNSTHVVNNYVQNDGYLVQDVEQALNIDALQKYLNTTETDFMILWNLLNDKLDGKPMQTLDLTDAQLNTGIETLKKAEPVKKRGRKPKKNV